jgi:hypothetical protein
MVLPENCRHVLFQAGLLLPWSEMAQVIAEFNVNVSARHCNKNFSIKIIYLN